MTTPDDEYHEDLISKTVKTQEAKKKTYDILVAKGLPVPPDLKTEMEQQDEPDATV